MDFLEKLKEEYSKQCKLMDYYKKMLDTLSKEKGRLALKGDGKQYYIIDNGREVYANRAAMKRVHRLKMKKLLEKAVKRLDGNTKALRRALKECKPYDYDELNKLVSAAYRGAYLPAAETYWKNQIPPFTQSENPHYPEELIHTTSFGLIVRTKGEMEIAELLYKMGIPFRYEMRLVLYDMKGNRTVMYPDFSIPLIENWFYIEHLGLLNKQSYRERNAEKLYEYHHNGILMPGQMIFTMDGPDGGLNVGPIIEFLNDIIIPRVMPN